MKLDVTLKITSEMLLDAKANEKKELEGHLGTHFDVMDKSFPLEYTEREAVVFDVSSVCDREIDVDDVDLSRVEPDSFVAFYTGFSDSEPYGTRSYFKEHPQLTHRLIDALLEKGVSIIGLDFAGIRRGSEHTPTDRRCADRGVFIIENLCNLSSLPRIEGRLVMHTYPMSFVGVTGLPCRVIAEA